MLDTQPIIRVFFIFSRLDVDTALSVLPAATAIRFSDLFKQELFNSGCHANIFWRSWIKHYLWFGCGTGSWGSSTTAWPRALKGPLTSPSLRWSFTKDTRRGNKPRKRDYSPWRSYTVDRQASYGRSSSSSHIQPTNIVKFSVFSYLRLFSNTFSPSYSSVNSDFSCSGKSLHICPMMRPISHSLSSGFSFFTWKAKCVTCVWDLLWHRPDPKPSCCTACRASRASPAPSVVLELHELEESWCRPFEGWTCCCHTAVVGRGWPSPRPAASEPSNNPVSLVLEGKAMQSVYKDRRGVWSIMVRKSILLDRIRRRLRVFYLL